MNGTKASIQTLVAGINAAIKDVHPSVQIFVAPPFPYLDLVRSTIAARVQVSGQNCHSQSSGAFTGEVSPLMLKDVGCTHVLLGHSERRSHGKEDIQMVGSKVKPALSADLNVVFCCGESLSERQAGDTDRIVIAQLQPLSGLTDGEWQRVVIAYEPVWAIGTGVVATPEQAQAAHASIRSWLGTLSSKQAASTPILYGGSVNSKNAQALAALHDVDGFLVGGASLQAAEFGQICSQGNAKAGTTK